MKRSVQWVLCFLVPSGLVLPLFAQEAPKTTTPPEPPRHIEKEVEIEGIDLSGLEIGLMQMQSSLERLQVELEPLAGLEIPPIPPINLELPALEPLEIEIPEIDIPEIDIPEIEIPDVYLDFDAQLCGRWGSLTEEEQVRLRALQAVTRRGAGQAVVAVEKILDEERSPALRYRAVGMLRRHLDDAAVIEFLGKIANTDSNTEVRKKAIRLLGESGDPRAVEILEEIVRR